MKSRDNHTSPKNSVLLSVVILAGPGTGTYRKKELFRCIESVQNSYYKNFEVIVVDNSCHEGLIGELNKFSNLRTIRLPTNTGAFGYSVGFANARGEYILALDDDCTVQLDTFNKIVDTVKKIPKTFGIICSNIYNPIGKYYYYLNYDQLKIKSICTFFSGATVFRKDLFEKVGYYDEDFFLWLHDADFAIRVLNAGYLIYFSEDIIINHHDNKNNKTSIRKKMLFLTFRNKAWLNLKHFSLRFFPFLILRDFVWIFLLARRFPLRASFYALIGFLFGYLTCFTALRKRHVVSPSVEKRLLKFYLFNKET